MGNLTKGIVETFSNLISIRLNAYKKTLHFESLIVIPYTLCPRQDDHYFAILLVPLGQSSTPKPALTTVQTFWMRHRSIQQWYWGSLNKRHHNNKQRHNNKHFHNNERESNKNNHIHTTSFQVWRAVSTTAVQSRTVTPLSLTRGLGPGHHYPADAWWLVQVITTIIGDWSLLALLIDDWSRSTWPRLMLIIENILFTDRLQSLKLCWSQRGRQLLHVWLRGI